jgi:predicted alpha/beta-fold hydrolase
MHDRLERIETPDGDHLTLVRMGVARPSVPRLLIAHGLEGTIEAKYAHGLMEQAARIGWSADMLMFRSCDGVLNKAPRLYHSGETADIDLTIRYLAAECPESPLHVCGISLGGNVVLKWLGEQGSAAQHLVRSAAAVSVPFDLAAGSRYLERGLSRLYTRHFLTTLKPKALAKAAQFPGRLDADKIAAARTFWDFDDAATAPLHGFRDAADYYERSSSIRFLHRVQVRTLLLSALDDPFVPPEVTEAASDECRRSSSIEMRVTGRGGHVGWISGSIASPTYYAEELAIEWLYSGM